MNENATKTSKTVTGQVISNKMDKTITVRVNRLVQHPLYGKFIRRSSKLLAHDDGNECQEGDTVIIEASRPLSKRKAWRLVKIVRRAETV